MSKRTEKIVDEFIDKLNEEKVDQEISKAVNFTHQLARMRSTNIDQVLRAMDTKDPGEGAEFVPTAFSADIIQQVALQRKVAALFDRIRMPSSQYTFPVEGGDPTAYFVPENTADSPTTGIPASNAGTAKMTFNAKKIAALVRLSDELEQDSIVPAIPYIQRKLLSGIAAGEENAFINGDTAAAHMDSNVTLATDVRKSVDGLRKKGLANTKKVDFAGSATTANLRALRAGLGIYGANPADVVLITSMTGFYRVLNNTDLMTFDKMGPNANLLTGQQANFDGSPIVVSEWVPSNLDVTGVYSTATGAVQTKTTILAVYRPGFMIGDRQVVELEQDRDIVYGQSILVAKERVDFQAAYAASQTVVNAGINL